MADDLTLFDLFGSFVAAWPKLEIFETTGVPGTTPDPASWLGALDNAVTITDVRTSSSSTRVSIEATLAVNVPATPGSAGFPFVLLSMPDVEFRVQNVAATKGIRMFASLSDTGFELLLEAVPVEIRLPDGFLRPHPVDEASAALDGLTIGEFTGNKPDEQKIVIRNDDPSSIFTRMRVYVDSELNIVLRPAVPISFGRCRFMGLACLAVHDFQLLPSPTVGEQTLDWIRHSIKPWLEDTGWPIDGAFAARTVHLDPDQAPIKAIREWIQGHVERDTTAQLVLDDLVLPFFFPTILPIPQHITVGIRRQLQNPLDKKEVYDFDTAPVRLQFGSDPEWGMIIESFFYRSQGKEAITESYDVGITFEAGIFFGSKSEKQQAITIGLGENLTPRIGYRREVDVVTGVEPAGANPGFQLLKWKIADAEIEILALTVGYSIGRDVGEGRDPGDCLELYGDLWVHIPPSGSDTSVVKLRGLSGEKVSVALRGLGWKQGHFSMEGLAFPDGIVMVLGPVSLVWQEIALLAEQGASYLAFSGGLLLTLPSGFTGGVFFKRLRFRVAGNEAAPAFKMDGFAALIASSVVTIEAAGYYTDEIVKDTATNEDWRRREFGLSGTIGLDLKSTKFQLALDLIVGDIDAPSTDFTYFMIQVAFKGLIPVYAVEIRGIRALFAKDMIPKLSAYDEASDDLRYYNWYKANDPAKVPGSRRLAAWKPQQDAIAAGIGCTLSLASIGEAARLTTFIMVVHSPPEKGVLVAFELYVLTAPKPMAWAVFDYDIENDRWFIQIGVDAHLSNFVDDLPSWLDKIAKLTGTILIGNKPATFAIGRINDMKTWLSLWLDLDVWVFKSFLQIGFCLEIVKGGTKGVGLVVRLEGGLNAGIIRIVYSVGFGFIIASFTTGSVDFAAVIWAEAGLRVVLFGFIKFGISAKAEVKFLGKKPERTELTLRLRFETPWFLPDITWTLEHSSGRIAPEEMSLFVAALQSGAAERTVTGATAAVHVERLDPNFQISPSRNFSLNELDSAGSSESQRLARFAANTDIEPIATDATLAIEFTALVTDRLNIGGAASNVGEQKSGDLSLGYELIGIRMRRRPRFGTSTTWTTVELSTELSIEFDGSGGTLSGTIGPQVLSKFWSPEILAESGIATKKLLLNATTPYDFVTENEENDEELVATNPYWPCCPPKRSVPRHRLDFRAETPGTRILGPRGFSESSSELRPVALLLARPRTVGSALPAGTVVAGYDKTRSAVLVRATLDEDALLAWVRLGWHAGEIQGELKLVAHDKEGREVRRVRVAVSGSKDFHQLLLPAGKPFSSFELWAAFPKVEGPLHEKLRTVIELDELGYVSVADYVDYVSDQQRCGPNADALGLAYSGKGKFFFLPNHQYEIQLETRISAQHTSTAAKTATVEEYLYFETKGLVGLNAVENIGAEIDPYVRARYVGGHARVYREEPVAIAFAQDFHVAVPLAVRPPGSSDEHNQLFRMALTVRPPRADDDETTFTTTTEDWIVDHRSEPVVVALAQPWKAKLGLSQTLSVANLDDSPFRQRLAKLTLRPSLPCTIASPLEVADTVLIAQPAGELDPDDASRELWRASTGYNASVRPEDAGFVERKSFVAADLTALSFIRDSGGSGSTAWSVADGEIELAAAGTRHFARFGEADWNHLRVQVGVRPGTGAVGLGLALSSASGVPTRGLFAIVEAHAGGRRLAIYRRRSGNQWELLESKTLATTPDVIPLIVHAYDDRLRATVDQVSVEVEREELREGRLALVGTGAVGFASLAVEGLEITNFQFRTSAFTSFADHITSFSGQVEDLVPDSFGSGTTSATVASLWTSTGAAVDAAMASWDAADERQRLFARWVADLALPLQPELTSLEISRYLVNGQVAALLLESPEPIDFVDEVTLELERRVRKGPVLDFGDSVRDWLERLLGRRTTRIPRPPFPPVREPRPIPEPLAEVRGELLEREMVRLDESVGVRRAPVPAAARERAGLAFTELARHDGGLRLALESPEAELPADRELELIEFVGSTAEGRQRLRVWHGRITRGPRGQRIIEARDRSELIVATEAELPAGLRAEHLGPGAIVVFDPDRRSILDWLLPRYSWETAAHRILQDETACRALVIPVDGAGAPSALAPGRMRMKFSLSRRRWPSTDPLDSLNGYQQTAQISFG
jgi:hypothetical protein